MDPNYLGIAIGIFLGLVGIAVVIFFGLRAFRTDIKGDLSTIKEKIIVIEETAKNAWDVIRRSPALGATGTVERNLKNLGKIKIVAEPHSGTTTYFLEVGKPILDYALIDKLSKETGLEQEEKEIFAGNVPDVRIPIPHRLIMELPSAEPSVCTKYMSLFLK
jgi:hypothetical protein